MQLKKTAIFEKDEIVKLSANDSVTYGLSTPIAGYVHVNFTASGGVYFLIGSDYIRTYYGNDYTKAYYFRYPSNGTAVSGSFIVPVFPGTTYVYIKNPALFIGVSVTFTITYVY